MYKNLLSWLTVLLVLPSCSGTSPAISVVCEENNIGNCIIKWETTPILKGQVKVYTSTSPEIIPEDSPIAMASISSGKMTIVTNDPSQRYYYLMVFNNKYRIKVATRNINIPGIQNFRDLGGYESANTGKSLRWGMIYRSAQIDSIPPCSRQELKNMGIRTIIDLRSESERQNYPQLHDDKFKIVHIPILTGNMEKILQGIREEKIKTDTIYRLVERMNRELVTNYQKEFKELFTILLDRSNYPQRQLRLRPLRRRIHRFAPPCRRHRPHRPRNGEHGRSARHLLRRRSRAQVTDRLRFGCLFGRPLRRKPRRRPLVLRAAARRSVAARRSDPPDDLHRRHTHPAPQKTTLT